MSDDELIERLTAAFDEPVPPASPERIAAIRAAADRARAQQAGIASVPNDDARAPRPTVGRRSMLLGAAAAAVGAVGGAIVTAAVRDDDGGGEAQGPPTEAFEWQRGESAGTSTLVGRLINHTWGVEVLLDTTGLPTGTAYRIRYLTTAGDTVEAGGFVGADLPIHCRCNAALLREDLAAIEIRDPDEALVARADFA